MFLKFPVVFLHRIMREKIIEKAGDKAASDFDIWASNFYSGVDDFMQAGKGALLLGSNKIAGDIFDNENALVNWGENKGWG